MKEQSSGNVVEIWQCDPLIVVNEQDEVVYNARTEVEFTSDDASGQQGGALAFCPDANGVQPWLSVDGHLSTRPDLRNLYGGRREGFTVFGHDDEGNQFTWYIGQAAVEYMTRRSSPTADRISESDAIQEVIAIYDASGSLLFGGDGWLAISPSMSAEHIHRLELEDTSYWLETSQETGQRPMLFAKVNGWIYEGVGPDDQHQTWLVGATARKALRV